MKTGIRFISMFFAILVIAGLALTASAKHNEAEANDEALQLVVDLGIIEGYGDGTLKPERLVERDEMAKIIFVLSTTLKDAGSVTATFDDVPADDWSAGYVSWCANKGIIGGYGDGNFGPNDNITYDQALKMVAGALGYTDWDSKFWPIDVRTVALTQLNLGDNISGVEGSDKLTRAQVAQMVRNALFADMKDEIDTAYIVTTTGSEIFIKAHKKLATSVWKFTERFMYVDAVGNTGEYQSLITTDDDVSLSLIGTDFTLEELGFEKYENRLNDLMFARVGVIYDSKKVANIQSVKADDILAVSVIETVDSEAKIAYNEEKDDFYINGQEIDITKSRLLSTSTTGEITTSTSATYKSALVNFLEEEYYGKFWVYDINDDDEDYEYIRYSPINAYKVESVGSKRISLASYPGPVSNTISIDLDNFVSSTELKKDDVILVYRDFANYVVESVVTPVSGAATKWNNKKLTLADGTVYAHGDKLFKDTDVYTVPKTVTDINDKKETTSYDYYIYDGKIFAGEVTLKNDLRFAVLSYITRSKTPVVDDVTMEKAYVYEALLTINGVEKTVKLNSDKAFNDMTADNMYNNIVDFVKTYGMVYTDGSTVPGNPDELYLTNDATDPKAKYLRKHHILVNYTVDRDGQYSIYTTANNILDDGDYVNFGVSDVKFNKAGKIYSITGANKSDTKALFADDVVLYYSYTKSGTGYYTYLGTYKGETFPANIAEFTTTSDLYATKDEDTGIYMINLAIIDADTLKYVTAGTGDYRTDCREILIAYESSKVTLASDGVSTYPSYSLMSIDGKTVHPKVDYSDKSVENGATVLKGSAFYAWSDAAKKYVEITNTDGFSSIYADKVDSFFGDVLFTKNGGAIKLSDDVTIWRIKKNATIKTPEYLTVDAFKDAFELCQADEDNKVDMRLIIGTYIEGDEEIVHTIFVEGWDLDASGKPSSTGWPKGAFDAFGS